MSPSRVPTLANRRGQRLGAAAAAVVIFIVACAALAPPTGPETGPAASAGPAPAADMSAGDRQGDSPLLRAAAEGRLDALRAAIAAGADLGSTDRAGNTALILAVQNGHVEAVGELLRTRVDPHHVNQAGRSALIEAVVGSYSGTAQLDIVRLLLARGTNPEQTDASGATPLAHAERRGLAAVAQLLRAAMLRDKPSTLER